MANAKYIVYQRKHCAPSALVFSETENHDHMRELNNILRTEVLGAGFVRWSYDREEDLVRANCFGVSASIGCSSRGTEDSHVVQVYLGMYD